MATEKPRFTITVTDEMLKEIDDFRYGNRFPTRTQAVNELFRIGLKTIQKKTGQEPSAPPVPRTVPESQ